MSLVNATSLSQVLELLAGGARPIAGGSDLVVGARQGKAPLPMQLVAIDRVAALREILVGDGGVRLGSLVNHATIETHPHLGAHYTALADGSALVGSPATRNVGTIGGNVMNASPAMDTGAPLSVLGAEVELASVRGTRRVTVDELWTGVGTTCAQADELCTAVELPGRPPRSGSAYMRLEYRRAMEIAVVGAAASVTLAEDGTVAAVSVALTAVAPTILPVDGLSAVTGAEVADAVARVAALASEQAVPITDLRASDRYRRHCVGVMAGRALAIAAERALGTVLPVPANRAIGIGAPS